MRREFLYKRIHPPIIGADGRVYKYELLEDYVYKTKIKGFSCDLPFLKLSEDGTLTILKMYASDGPSGPALDTTNFIRAAFVHDALYQLIREGILSMRDRRAADKLLRKIAREDGMGWWRRWWVWSAVRLGARSSAKRKNMEVKK